VSDEMVKRYRKTREKQSAIADALLTEVNTMRFQNTNPIFDYKALRLMLGIIALALPFLVTAIAKMPLPSISASYFTGARDTFVGLLFVVGGLMLAYNGHTSLEAFAAKIAATCALLVALFPTAKACGDLSQTASIHAAAAVLLFSILAWFCFVPFRKNTKGKGGKKGRRAKLYFACGSVIVASMALGLISKLFFSCEKVASLDLIYWVEAISLGAFGVAWIVAGKVIPALVDEDEQLRLFRH
jgi:hypothetical protein